MRVTTWFLFTSRCSSTAKLRSRSINASETRAIFLLESASLGEETGRYSFIGLDRRWRLSTRDEVTVVESDTYAESALAPLDELRRLLSTYRTFVPANYPTS